MTAAEIAQRLRHLPQLVALLAVQEEPPIVRLEVHAGGDLALYDAAGRCRFRRPLADPSWTVTPDGMIGSCPT